MKHIDIKADEELFDKWIAHGVKVGRLNSIIQNDIKISSPELSEWVILVKCVQEDFEALVKATARHIAECNSTTKTSSSASTPSTTTDCLTDSKLSGL